MSCHPYFETPLPVVIAHRGSSGEAPENTHVAFARALQQGAAIIESDLHVTRDGVPVLLHQRELHATTQGEGWVEDHSFAQLSELDAGFRFTADGGRTFPFRGCGLRVPGLEEAFKAFPGVRFNLELKVDEPDLIESTVALVSRAGREALTLLTAESDTIMSRLRAHLRQVALPVALGSSRGEVQQFLLSASGEGPPPAGAMALQIPVDYEGTLLITPALVRHAHAHGVAVHAFTINDTAEMERLLEMGVDGIVTDFPARLSSLIEQRRRRRSEP